MCQSFDFSIRPFHHHFSRSAAFFHASTLTPKPSLNFGLHTISHLIVCSFLVRLLGFSPSPQKKRFFILSNSVRIPTGNLYKLSQYVGMASNTALIRTSLPACDSVEDFHEANFVLIFLRSGTQNFFLLGFPQW